MKKYALLLSVFGIIFFVSSCQKEPFLQLSSPSSITFTNQGGSQIISMTTNRAWTASSSESWCKVSPSSGEASESGATITVTCEPNATYDSRICAITIKVEGLTQSIAVSQETNYGMQIDQSVFNISAEEQTIRVNIRSNIQLDIMPSVDWISFVETRGLSSNNIILAIQTNESYDQRIGLVVIREKGGAALGEIEVHQDTKDLHTPLTIEAINDGTINISNPMGLKIEYRKDGGWKTTEEDISIPISKGEAVAFRGDNEAYATSSFQTRILASTGCYIYGNIMSLIKSNAFEKLKEVKDWAFYGLFYNDLTLRSSLTNHPTKRLLLPATTVGRHSYEALFAGSKITTAPELPATKLSNYCYANMFQDCSQLTTAPELPSTELADGCYVAMFTGCSSLAEAPDLPASKLKRGCYASMFSRCTGLVSPPELQANSIDVGSYEFMFDGCTRLVNAPDLPATQLDEYCYQHMFRDCINLSKAPDLPANELALSCYDGMFENCIRLIEPPKLPAINLEVGCYSYMFSGCTSLTKAPDLPALFLARSCYSYMFYECASLNYISAAFITKPGSDYTDNWVAGVSKSGIFVKNKYASWVSTDNSSIPSGWKTVYDADSICPLFFVDSSSFGEEGSFLEIDHLLSFFFNLTYQDLSELLLDLDNESLIINGTSTGMIETMYTYYITPAFPIERLKGKDYFVVEDPVTHSRIAYFPVNKSGYLTYNNYGRTLKDDSVLVINTSMKTISGETINGEMRILIKATIS